MTMDIIIHEIAIDGLPDMDALTARVAFLVDGCIVSGWPLPRDEFSHLYDYKYVLGRRDAARSADTDFLAKGGTLWEADSDVGSTGLFAGVTHWVEFPIGIHLISSAAKEATP